MTLALTVALTQSDGALARGDKDEVSVTLEGTTLIVAGSPGDDIVVLHVKGGDGSTLAVDVPSDPSSGRQFKRAKVESIRVDAGAGDDTITIDESAGVFTDVALATIRGEDGNDTLTGGAGMDVIRGGAGNDVLAGRGGADSLFGGDGDDLVAGGPGDDISLGEAGNDQLVWNPGDGSDINEGGDGMDVVVVQGGGAAEQFGLTANGTRVRFDRLSPAPFFLDIGTSEEIDVRAGGGDDSFSAVGNLATLIAVTVDGEAGNDTILGSNGADTLRGGDGNDFIDGQQGADAAFGGAGDDVFQWDPGDGSDTLDGESGADRLDFNGSNIGEAFDINAVGTRVRLARNIGTVVMDFAGIEGLDLATLGGADSVTVGDMSGTELDAINLDLAATGGGGDAAADTILVQGTPGDDFVTLSGDPSGVSIAGLPAGVSISGGEPATDALTIELGGGDDFLNATTVAAGALPLSARGGEGDDILQGGEGDDTFFGEEGNDLLVGNGGVDMLDGGAGDNVVIQ